MVQTFQDWDLNKVQNGQVTPKVVEHDNMFEDLWGAGEMDSLDAFLKANGGGEDMWGADTSVAAGDAAAGATSAQDATTTGDGSDTNAGGEDTTGDDQVPGEGTDEWEDAVVQEILNNIGAAGEKVDEANANLSTAIAWGDQAEIKKAYDELLIANTNKDRQIEILTKELENEKSQSDKFLNERLMAETDGREQSGIYNTVMDNPLLKQIVVYSKNMDSNPEYKDKLIDAAKKLYEETAGVSIDDLINQNKTAEKRSMSDWSFLSEWVSTPSEWLLDGMFEQL